MNCFHLVCLLLLIILCSCKGGGETPSILPEPESRLSLEQFLDSTSAHYISVRNKKVVAQFYEENNFVPAWSMPDSLLPVADSLIHFIYKAPFFGLFPEAYRVGEIRAALQSEDRDRLLPLDILLTDAFFSLRHDLKYGRNNPSNLYDSLEENILQQRIAENSVIQYLKMNEPQHATYRNLKIHLAKILKEKGHEAIEVEDTIQTIFSNLERWRWELPFPDRFIFVNVPSFMMKVVDKNEVVLESRVIVGQPDWQTKRITSKIERFTIYPYWHVPRKIAISEMLPLIQRDTGYINRNNLDVLDRNGKVLDPSTLKWKTFHEDYFPVILRQREGPDNSLGVIKFQFKNPYAIYLHDTNAKGLFRKDDRALSHGCVRVEKARDLAFYLVKDDSILCTPDDLAQYLEIKHRMEINIVNPIPVFIRYFTAEASADTLLIYKDIYEMDKIN